ncbi:hypothetical protein [Novipirellula rosea]
MNAFLNDWSPLNAVVERLGWILVHSVWQFVIIGLVAALLMVAFRSASSKVRYGSLLSLFALASMAPVATWFVLPPITVELNQPVELMVTPAASTAGVSKPSNAVSPPGLETEKAVSPSIVRDPTSTNPPPRRDLTRLKQKFSHALVPYLHTIVIVWCLGVIACSLRPLIGWRMVRRLRSVGTSQPSPEIVALFNRVTARLLVKRAVAVLESTIAKTPMMVGCFRPVVLLPVSLVANIPVSQLESILGE